MGRFCWVVPVALIGLVGGLVAMSGAPPRWVHDIDTHTLRRGLEAAPRFSDTLSWWTGTWVGIVPFWRPLTSLVFWGEWRLFGENLACWQAVSVLLGIALAFAMRWGMAPLIGRAQVVLLVAYAYFGAVGAPWDSDVPLYAVLHFWKNQPDLLAGIGIFVAVGALVRGRPWLWCAAAVGAVGCKEIGFAAFPLGALAVAYQRSHGREIAWKWPLAAGAVCALVLSIWHYLAVGGGYQMGSNNSWWARALFYYSGYLPVLFYVGKWGIATLCLVSAGAVLRLRPVAATVTIVAAFTAVAAGMAAERGLPWETAASCLLLDCAMLPPALLWLLLARVGICRAWPGVTFGVAWMLVGAAPTFAAAQVVEHARWLGSIGQGIICAHVLTATGGLIYAAAKPLLGRMLRHPSRTARSAQADHRP